MFSASSAHLVVQDDILLFHARHKRVLGQVIGSTPVLLVGSADLFVQSLDIGWQQPAELEFAAFILGKG